MKEQSTTKGFAILSAATMAVKLLSLIYMPLLVRILVGDRAFSIYSVTYQIYVFIYVITNTGIPSAISKLVSEFVAVNNYKAAVKTFKMSRSVLFVVGVVMALIMYLVSGIITTRMGYPEAKMSVVALCPAILFTSVASAYRGYFQGRGNMKPTAISQVLEQIINTIFSLGFAALFIKYGIEKGCVGATIGTTLGALVSGIYLLISYERTTHLKPRMSGEVVNHKKYSSKQITRKILRYGIPITLCIGVTNAGNLVDTANTTKRLIVAGFSNNAAQTLFGGFSKYITLINVPITIISALTVVVLPAVSKAIALNDRRLAKRKINFGFKLCFIIAIPCAVGLSVLSEPIFTLLFSTKYLGGYKLMLYGSTVLVLMSFVQVQTSILQGLGRIKVVTIYSVIGIIIKISTNYILIAIPNININGAIIGSILGFLVPIILNFKYIEKVLKQKIRLKRFIMKPLVSSICMGIVLYVVYYGLSFILAFGIKGYINNAIATIGSIFIGSITYGLVMLITKGITNEELNILPYRVRKLIPQRLL